MIPLFRSYQSTVTPFERGRSAFNFRIYQDPVTGAPAGIQTESSTGPDGIWTPVDLTAAQIAAPSALMLADLNAVYRLDEAPYTRYYSNGTTLVNIAAGTGYFIFADQYVSIQAAVDALPTTGGAVLLPPDTTYEEAVSTTKPNVHLWAPGGWGTVFKRPSTMTTGILVALRGAGSIAEGFTVDGNNVVPTNYSGFSELFVSGANVIARNCQIINSRGTINLTLAGANAKALFNTITGPGIDLGLETGYGIWAINGDAVHIEGNVITGTCIDGIGVNGAGSKVINNYVSGCHCYAGNGGGQIAFYATSGTKMSLSSGNYIGPGGGAAADGLEVSATFFQSIGDEIDRVQGNGIHLTVLAGKVTLSDGIVRDIGSGNSLTVDGIRVDAATSNLIIQGMRVTDDQGSPTMRDAIIIASGASDNLVITGNVLAPNGHLALVDQSTGVQKVIRDNLGIDNILGTISSAGTITLLENNVIVMTGSATVTAIAGNLWQNRELTIFPTGASVFTAGATIGNTVTCVANEFRPAKWLNGKLYFAS